MENIYGGYGFRNISKFIRDTIKEFDRLFISDSTQHLKH